MQPDGMLALMKWEEETPYVYFFKHGLDEEKVVSIGNSHGCIFLFYYIFILSFVLCSFFPRLISAAVDWMSTILLHMVWPWCEFKMQVRNLRHTARWKHRSQKIAIWAPSHNFVGLYLRN